MQNDDKPPMSHVINLPNTLERDCSHDTRIASQERNGTERVLNRYSPGKHMEPTVDNLTRTMVPPYSMGRDDQRTYQHERARKLNDPVENYLASEIGIVRLLGRQRIKMMAG